MELTPEQRKLKQIARYCEFVTPYSASEASTPYSKGFIEGVIKTKEYIMAIINRK